MHLGFSSDVFSYAVELGLIPSAPEDRSLFKLEPQVKLEEIWHGTHKRPGTTLLQRKQRSCWVRDRELKRETYGFPLNPRESILSQIREPGNYPDIASIASTVSRWRFYDQFDIGRNSPIRQPQVGFYTPVLSDSGWDLAAALQTIEETGRSEELNQLVWNAFGGRIAVESADGYFTLGFQSESLRRRLKACELSDGTLRFLCLAAALLSKEPAEFLVLNEPENSLHEDLFEPLANLIQIASEESQIWVITHSQLLAQMLSSHGNSKTTNLLLTDGETTIEGQGLILED